MSEYLKTQEVADKLGVSRQRIVELVNSKVMPVIRLGKKTWRFHEETVVNAMTTHAAKKGGIRA